MHPTEAAFLDLDTISRDDLDLSPLTEVCSRWRMFPSTSKEETLEHIRGVELLVSNKAVLDRGILERATELRLICIAATGSNNVDLEAAGDLGIAVTNVAGYSTASVVQHVFALILALTTRLPDYRDALRRGAWQESRQFCLLDFPIRELEGKVLGIVGHGALGKAVAKIGEAFGLEVRLAQRPGGVEQPGRPSLDRLLAEVDILSLHCPLTEQTRNLIGERELGLMRPDALLINAARGGIVDEAALARVLREGQLGGAGVDVLELEPPVEGNPLLELEIPNLIVTPHIAWASRESRQRLIQEIAGNIQAFFQGRERNRVV